MTLGDIEIFEGADSLRSLPGADLKIRFQIYGYVAYRPETTLEGLKRGHCFLWCHDEPAPDCRTFWGSHGCCLVRGHDGPCFCECAWQDDESWSEPYFDRTVATVGGTPYYGPDTRFYGEDALCPR